MSRSHDSCLGFLRKDSEIERSLGFTARAKLVAFESRMSDQNLKAELERLRGLVDRHNVEIERVLKERAAVVLQIAAVKRALGRPALDAEREEETLGRLRNRSAEPLTSEDLVMIFRAILDVSRRIQERI